MGLLSRVEDTMAKIFFAELDVVSTTQIAERFRRIELHGETVAKEGFRAGDKLQILIPGAGPRTYSPFGLDRARGTFSVLAYVHGEEPGATWAATARVGAVLRAFGPRRSLALEGIADTLRLELAGSGTGPKLGPTRDELLALVTQGSV